MRSPREDCGSSLNGGSPRRYSVMRKRRRIGVALSVAALAGASLVFAAASPGRPAHETTTLAVAGPSFAGTSVPTGTKRAESTVWWNDGSWWANMWSRGGHAFHIFRFAVRSRHWIDTRTEVDHRANTSSDVLWDGRHLYVASHRRVRDLSPTQPGTPSYLYRFSYSRRGHRYTLDSGFPTVINHDRTETLVIGEDGRHQLWATWQQDDRIYLNHTTRGNQRRWAIPTPLGFPQARATVDDISSLVGLPSGMGLMWSNQSPGLDALYFSIHRNGAPATDWTPPEQALSGPRTADDHINLKADASGVVYAAVKTSNIHNDPLTLLLVRSRAGSWQRVLFGTAEECHNRPVVVLDERHRLLHMFATAPDPSSGVCSSSGGAIYEKTTSLDSISFAPGRGQLVLSDPADPFITNASAGKQPLIGGQGLLVLAANLRTSRYRTFYSR